MIISNQNQYLITDSFPTLKSSKILLKRYFFTDNFFKWVVSIHGKYDSYLDNNFKKKFPDR